MKLFPILTAISLICLACKKEKVTEAAPSLTGTWKHYSAAGAWHIISIDAESEGKMEWFTNGEMYKDTKVRTWYMKDNTIYFGKVALNGELYEIIDFPTISTSQSVELFDTLFAGKRFMETDKGFYVEQ